MSAARTGIRSARAERASLDALLQKQPIEILKDIEELYKANDYSEIIARVEFLTETTLDIFQQTEIDKLYYALLYNYAGHSHYADVLIQPDNEKRYTVALEYFKRSKLYFQAINEDFLKESGCGLKYSDNLLMQGICEKELGSPDKLFYFTASIASLTLAISQLDNLPQASQIIDMSTKAHFALGQARAWSATTKADYEASIQALLVAEKNLSTASDKMISHHFLGLCLLKLEDYGKAISYLTELLEMANTDVADEPENIKAMKVVMAKDAELGIGLCEGMQSQFNAQSALGQSALGKLGSAFVFYDYHWERKESLALLDNCICVAREWIRGLSLPSEELRPHELRKIVELVADTKQEEEEITVHAVKSPQLSSTFR